MSELTQRTYTKCGSTTNPFPGANLKCKLCVNGRVKELYRKDPSYRAKILARNATRHKTLKQLVDSKKDAPCIDCGNKFPTVCMDFDHLGDKYECIGTMLSRNAPIERLLAEIAKCEVVCSNCHRIRTEVRRQAAKVRA